MVSTLFNVKIVKTPKCVSYLVVLSLQLISKGNALATSSEGLKLSFIYFAVGQDEGVVIYTKF